MRRDLDLKMDDHEEGPTGPAAAPKTDGLSEAHEMLLKEIDDVKNAAHLVIEKMEALDARLAAREGSLLKQGDAMERAARESLAEASREWAETAQRFRKFVDELGTLAAFHEKRLAQVPSARGPMVAAIWGGFLAGLLALLLSGPVATRIADWLMGPSAPVSAQDAVEPAAGTKKPGKAGVK